MLFPHLLFLDSACRRSLRGLYSHIDSTILEHSTVVPNDTTVTNRKACNTAKDRIPTNGSLQPSTPSSADGPIRTSRMEDLRQVHVTEGVSKWATDLMLAGWIKGTNSTYQSAWSKWTGWCSSRQINPFSTDIQYFLDFLAIRSRTTVSFHQYSKICSLNDSCQDSSLLTRSHEFKSHQCQGIFLLSFVYPHCPGVYSALPQ